MTNPEDIVTIDDGVRGDDTMDDFYQKLRVDLIKKPPIKSQIMFTRKHKLNSKLSKNVGYISYSNQGDLFKLARLCFAAGMALMFNGIDLDLKNAVRVHLHAQIPRVKELTEEYMEGLKG